MFYVHIMKELYNNLEEVNIPEERFGSEIIVGACFNLYENIQKHHLYNLHVSPMFNGYTEQRVRLKYTKEFLESM